MKVLIFTTSYFKRPYFLRQSILSGMNQSYSNLIHSINITTDKDVSIKDYSPLYNDLTGNFIVNYSINEDICFSHFNNMNTIRFVPNYDSYDIFVKMDDDDIYKRDYVKNIVELFSSYPEVDIVSTKITCQLNGWDLRTNPSKYNNLGGNPESTDYAMPNTFAFTKQALDAIINLKDNEMHGHDDLTWRVAWHKKGLIHKLVNNEDNVIWHIHGKNASVGYFLTNTD